ncbi:MAG TPA: hypothetical protein VF981_08855 [Gemmatimonadaceae bacterium]
MSALGVLALVQAVTLSGSVQQGVNVRPDTVHVGDPFTVSIRIRAPQGSTIEFPPAPDSGGPVDPLDPVLIQTAADSAALDQTATYRLAAWRVGAFDIEFPDILVRQDIGSRRIPVSGAGIVVASVLPSDSSLHVPRPPRAVFTFGLPWWVWILLAAAVSAVAMLIWWLWHRRRGRSPTREAPLTVAEREFDRIEALGLVAAGERARHVDLMVEVLRDYLAASIPGVSTSQTSSEMAASLRRARLAPHSRCLSLLTEVDLVKFAGRPLGADRAAALGREARAVANAAEVALTAPAGAKAA